MTANKRKNFKFFEKHIFTISVILVFGGTFIAFIMPSVLSRFHLFGLEAPNEMGDALNGLSVPFITLMGVFLTFIAFYVQHMANERQVEELEKQKRNIEYKYIQEEISELKNEIRQLAYTKDGKTYLFAEAIWYYIHDSLESGAAEEVVKKPIFFQMAYSLSLFEPMLDEIDRSNLSDRDKMQSILNLNGLFEASIELILRINEKIGNTIQSGDGFVKNDLRTKIITPAKKVKMLLQEKLKQYAKPEKEQFIEAYQTLKIAPFVRQAKYVYGQGSILFYPTYEAYKNALPPKAESISRESYKKLFTDSAIKKMLATEPVKLMMKLDFIDKIEFKVCSDKKEYIFGVTRAEFEEYCKLEIAELNIDKELWRDAYQGKFVYDKKSLNDFIDKFTRVKDKPMNFDIQDDKPEKASNIEEEGNVKKRKKEETDIIE
ncbi:MAG: hypothetical protein OHK0038_24260 [Flammeovirgaceae bacterium]